MKKTIIFMAAICALMMISCEKNHDETLKEDGQMGQLSLTVDVDDEIKTKAVTAYTEHLAYEKSANRLQILVFDTQGRLNAYHKDGTADLTDVSITTTIGKKTIYAVINGPDLSGIKSHSALQAFNVALAENSLDSSVGFVMAGSVDCEVLASSVSTPVIKASRLVSRVALQKIHNSVPSAYGSIKINSVVLANVVGNQNVLGNASISTWYNKAGRNASGNIIDCSSITADCASLTSELISKSVPCGYSLAMTSPYVFYCYPNSTTTDVQGWNGGSFSARKTRLVVSADINGTTYYYPVTLTTAPVRNTTYTIELTITGLGSTDPDKPVEKGAFSATIQIADWSTGKAYSEVI